MENTAVGKGAHNKTENEGEKYTYNIINLHDASHSFTSECDSRGRYK